MPGPFTPSASAELQTILRVIASELPRLAENPAELRAAHANLQSIRRLLAPPEIRPR